ncbi:MAG: hypothetical protein LBO77_00220 [Desulfovibrio sp.]|jgi:hypothetical protein|nr:hypothetical protein [Desulfovibrio sp.]
MARKETLITLQDRDQELIFKIREMSATRLESWMIRALLLIASSGVDTPDGADIQAVGEYLAERGLRALGGIEYEKASPLLDEMLACCSRVVEKVEERCTPQTVDAYILDVSTLVRLRMEAAKLNLGFLLPEGAAADEKPSGFPGNGSTEMRLQ